MLLFLGVCGRTQQRQDPCQLLLPDPGPEQSNPCSLATRYCDSVRNPALATVPLVLRWAFSGGISFRVVCDGVWGCGRQCPGSPTGSEIRTFSPLICLASRLTISMSMGRVDKGREAAGVAAATEARFPIAHLGTTPRKRERTSRRAVEGSWKQQGSRAGATPRPPLPLSLVLRHARPIFFKITGVLRRGVPGLMLRYMPVSPRPLPPSMASRKRTEAS